MAVDYKDYYKLLGVSKDADQKEIQRAFRRLARQYHPDVNPGDKEAENKFKEINEANEVLSDPEKRKKYDEMSTYYQQYGSYPGAGGAGFAGQGTGPRPGGQYQYRTVNQEDLEDLFGGDSPFSDFFETYFHSGFSGPNARRTRRGDAASARARAGEDVEADIEITLSDTYQGTTRTLELSEPDGSSRRLEVKIPAGVTDGARIRIANQGMQGTPRGHLYLRVHVTPDARFTLDGMDLRSSVDVPLTIAMLGGEAPVQLPDGRRLLLRIPPGTDNGRALRLRGKGMPRMGHPDERGDLYAEVHVVLPTQLTDEQRRLFEAFAHSLG
ncbi:DnaJ C-terminal domain-containing protein [Dictyobacter arantiisoli]|uniref:Molecular chaperone DnaJ n=1 Tax=Dictyobacter arantiisoli TaxID=2014874 RepID=A0A5A5TAL9_9CHLR|nr:J domain-containing protein [Dictyobacter arantiisoli]GCF08472.1 molecular chaperone DnaJ [Dictyobacter arantiisoli]